jgi:hypothetical protein
MTLEWLGLAIMIALKLGEFTRLVTLQPGERPIVPDWRDRDGREHGRRGVPRAGQGLLKVYGRPLRGDRRI